MLKKIFWSIVLLFVLFVLSVFKAPELAKSVANLTGFPNLPQKIISFKGTYDIIVTDIPSQEELSNQYTTTLSGALELKQNLLNGVETTKQTVDSLRETMSGAEKTIDELKGGYNEAKDFIDEAGKKIDEAKKIIEDTNAVINKVKNIKEDTNTGTTE